MDHHLKDRSNRFDDLQPVRLEVRSSRDRVHAVRWETNWPLSNTECRRLYLSPNGLGSTLPEVSTEISYAANGGSAQLDLTFDEDTELSGHVKLRLWVEARPATEGAPPPDDMILCCFLDKRDRQGRSVRFHGSVGQSEDMLTRGYIRVSRRALDEGRTTEWLPVLRGDSEQRLAPGEVVAVDISLCPISVYLAAGEGLRLIVSSTEIVHAPVFRKDTSINEGRHVLHFGGSQDSHLSAPFIAAAT